MATLTIDYTARIITGIGGPRSKNPGRRYYVLECPETDTGTLLAHNLPATDIGTDAPIIVQVLAGDHAVPVVERGDTPAAVPEVAETVDA